jgi:hypothetical protein
MTMDAADGMDMTTQPRDGHAVVILPEPNGTRGSGQPAWWIANAYNTSPTGISSVVNPTERYNRNDADMPSIHIGLRADEWPLEEAELLAGAILAAVRAARGRPDD